MTTKDNDYWLYYQRAVKAGSLARKAIYDGVLIRPDTCELCDRKPEPITSKSFNHKNNKRSAIFAHHWHGYDFPLDVWWLCNRCNRRLSGEQFHNGSITKEQARKIITEKSKVDIVH